MHNKLIVFILGILSSCLVNAHGDVWVGVDTNNLTLSVMRGEEIELSFNNISIGRYGASKSRMMGDNRTPLGTFRIGWIKESSRFHRFFVFDFPNREAADLALAENRITKETWQSIVNALNTGQSPPQNTPLGGYLGIHGLGRGDQKVHQRYNWTNGCIALTNAQIDQLSKWLKPGVLVKVW